MAQYKPIDQFNKESWETWLREVRDVLESKPNTGTNSLFETPDDDMIVAKDLVGTLLATITESVQIIN